MYVQIDPQKQTQKENYKLLSGSVLPRPIAFVTSKGKDGTINAAPFSFYNVICPEPPMIGFCCTRGPDGGRKDTSRNILEQEEFVVHVVDQDIVKMVNDAAIPFPQHISEVEEIGFTCLESKKISVPRLKEAKIQMECRLYQLIELGEPNKQPAADFILGEIVYFHIHRDVYVDGKIETEILKPVGRLAGTNYTHVGEAFSFPPASYETYMDLKRKSKKTDNP